MPSAFYFRLTHEYRSTEFSECSKGFIPDPKRCGRFKFGFHEFRQKAQIGIGGTGWRQNVYPTHTSRRYISTFSRFSRNCHGPAISDWIRLSHLADIAVHTPTEVQPTLVWAQCAGVLDPKPTVHS